MSNGTVSVDTDDLDAFTDLLNGEAEASPEPEVEADEGDSEDIESGEVDAEEEGVEEDDTGDDTPAEDDEDSEDEPITPPKKKNRFQERIDDLTTKFRNEQRDKEALIARLEALESKKVTPEAPEAPAETNALPDPDAVNADGSEKYPLGDLDPAYITDLHKAAAKLASEDIQKAAETARKSQEAITEQAKAQTVWETKLKEAEARYPDINDRDTEIAEAFEGLDPQYQQYLASTIMSMEHGVDVLYLLSEDPESAREIFKSGPLQATIKLGRLEASVLLDKKEDKPTVRSSKAPTPPPTNKGLGKVKVIDDDTDSLDDFEQKFFSRGK